MLLRPTEITIGVDESGTGAWAGPFTVCALAGYVRDEKWFRELGVTDSKKLSDSRRRDICAGIAGYALAGHIAEVSVFEISCVGQRPMWRAAAREAIGAVFESLQRDGIEQDIRIIIDGNTDDELATWLGSLYREPLHFVPKADLSNAFVGAASILAKTRRNNRMQELHEIYPEYGWAKNAGYGVPKHKQGIAEHGITSFHREIKPLKGLPLREETT